MKKTIIYTSLCMLLTQVVVIDAQQNRDKENRSNTIELKDFSPKSGVMQPYPQAYASKRAAALAAFRVLNQEQRVNHLYILVKGTKHSQWTSDLVFWTQARALIQAQDTDPRIEVIDAHIAQLRFFCDA